jgi:hypothetical protein
MPWCVPIPMITSGSNPVVELVISADAQDYDLFTAAGSPGSAIDLFVTLNSGVTIDTMLANSFPDGTNIYFTVLGTLRGRGGDGGDGGLADGSGPATMPGQAGSAGGHAFFSSAGISLFLNIDDGNAWGGGGGGGGGAGCASLGSDQGGGGGGGGQGWNTSLGGAGGSGVYASGGAGANGGSSAAGAGGTPGGGGDGGDWGLAGGVGLYTSGICDSGKSGGSGGARGRAFLLTGGASITFTGSKSISTLESEGRIKGGAVAS